MIEIRINKEIGTYEPKIIGPLTVRQTICVGCAAPFCFFIYNFLSPLITPDLAGFFCFIPAVIAYFFGWRKPYGMPMEKFIQSIFITTLMAPANRRYKTVNRHELILKKLSDGAESEDEGKSKKFSLKKPIKSRYKVSSLAIN